MLLYPFAVVIAVWLGLDPNIKILGDIFAVYFVSVVMIVATFYGKEVNLCKEIGNNPWLVIKPSMKVY